MIKQHATPQHLHITTRRNFIGPIPEGWLRSHRKSWYREALKLSNYSSRTATFTASFDASHRRALTGPNGLSASAIFQSSFPQPDDAEEDEGKDNEDGDSGNDDRSDEERKNKNLERASVGRFGSKKAGAGQKSRPDDKKAGTFESESPEASQNLRKRRSSTGLRERESTPSKINTSMSKPVVEHETGQLPDTPQSTLQTKSDNGEIPTAGDASNSTASLIPHGKDHVSAPIPSVPAQTGLVRFNIPGSAQPDNSQLASESIPPSRRRTWRQIRRSQFQPGEIVKMEKMLVRVDSTMQKLPSEYNENDSLKTESRIVEKWREFVVVCRESTDQESDFLIQMYKSRVIPAIEKPRVSKRATHEIPLIRRKTRINLYSVLDKTLVIWIPWKVGTRIYILRTHSSANAVEWYTFLRSSLGWKRSSNLEVHVPDLSVTLQLEDPFGELESTRDATRGPEGFSEDTITKVLEAERAATGKIIQRCIKTLEGSPEWTDVLNSWLSNEKMGLAWKRYDRLEWVHGANEQKMYGTIAMLKSYDLELRPKQHYPTDVKLEDEEFSEEPIPVEGFLIRLTSQRGYHKRFGKMFYKRLYFSTHNQFLCYCRPAKALPPPPPTLTLTGNSKVPSAHHIVHHTPLIYTVDPYPVSQGKINWLGHGNSSTLQKHDHEAYKEAERKVNTLLRAEGYINLSHIVRIRHVRRGSTPADVNIEQGSDVDFHEPVDDTTRDDGTTDQFDDGRTFEMVLKNGLIIRLQAYNERTKKEWMMGLNQLARYWKCRLAADMQVFKMIRQLNLERLEIDEEMESLLGQFAEKWEVTRAKASPQLFNMCGISCCRPITVFTCHTPHQSCHNNVVS